MSRKLTGLVRVTIAAPQRRLDLAVPEQSAVAEVLPGLLTRAGEHLADTAAPDGGWVLRRTDGSPLELGKTIGAHRIRDGEILHLVPRATDWPELEYDDLVDAIATGSGRFTTAWTAAHTRLSGLCAGAIAASLGLVAILRAGPPWPSPALWSLVAAALLLGAGVALARAFGDGGAGAVVGALGLPFAFLGGGLLLVSEGRVGGPHLLAGSAVLLLAGVIGSVGIVAAPAVFTGTVTAGLLGVIGGWLGSTSRLSAAEAAAILASALLVIAPAFASWAIRLGRLPMPTLPRTTADLVRDDPQPSRSQVYAAVVRADGLLTGMLGGAALAWAVCLVLLVRGGSGSATGLAVLVSVGLLLRARLYPIVRQRLLFLAAGLTGAGGLVLGPLVADDLDTVVPALLLLAGLLVFVGLRYSLRPTSPYLARYAEILEVIVVLAAVPVTCSVVGLYAYVRGLGG